MTDTRDKAAILLNLLGPDMAESVLAQLPSPHAATLRAQMPRTRVSARKQADILSEFDHLFRALGHGSPPTLSIVHPDGDGQSSASERRSAGAAQEAANQFQPTHDALGDCLRLSPQQLAGALSRERPRTIALLVQVLPPDRTADILRLLPEDLRPQTVLELSRVTPDNETLIETIATATVRRAATLSADDVKRADRIQQLADVLRSVEKSYRAQMFAAIKEQDSETADQVMARLYRFDDLSTIDDRVIQKVLGEVDSTTLSTALFQADAELLDRIVQNLSKRAGQSLKEELEFQSHLPANVVENARELVAQAIAKIDQESDG